MNIAHLSTFYPFRGGIAQFNALLFRELEKGHSVNAFNFTRQYPKLFFPGETQFVTAADNADPVPNQRVLDSVNPLTYAKTARQILAGNPDLLLMRFWMPFFAPSLGYVSGKIRRSGIKSVAILDNVIPHEKRPGDITLLKYFLNRCDGFIAMSRSVENELNMLKPEARYILKPHPIYEHFGNAVSREEALKKLRLPGDRKILLYFGFIRKYKGLDTLLKAAALLPDEYLLVIAGEMYGDFTPYQKMIDQFGLENRVQKFIRYIPDHEVKDFFSAADVCVLPYRSATQSGITQIAFNFNLPVICTDVGGLSEMVIDGRNGMVLKSQNPDELAEKIKLYFKQQLHQTFSDEIVANRSQYSWKGFADALIDFSGTL